MPIPAVNIGMPATDDLRLIFQGKVLGEDDSLRTPGGTMLFLLALLWLSFLFIFCYALLYKSRCANFF